MIHNTEVEVLHGTTLTTKIIHKTDIVLHPEIYLVMTKILLLHNTLYHDVIIINATQDRIVLSTDLLIDLLTDTTLVLDIDHAHIQETIRIYKIYNFIQTTSRPRDSRFSRSRSHSISRNKVNHQSNLTR